MPKKQSTAARRARETARVGGKYTTALRETSAAQADEPFVCEREFIDGSWYGDDCPDCREQVSREMGECETCDDEDDYCSKHQNGIWS